MEKKEKSIYNIYMTCFWQGIIKNLSKEDFDIIGIKSIKNNNIDDIRLFINKLKYHSENNKFNIQWQGTKLTLQEIEELKIYIKNYNINEINHGHPTSSCDPFICLLCDLLKCKIIFNYCNNQIIFIYNNNIRKTFKFNANKSHFSG